MGVHLVDLEELRLAERRLITPPWALPPSRDVVAVHATDEWTPASAGPDTLITLPVVVVCLTDHPDDPPPWCDVAIEHGSPQLDAIVAMVERCPVASAALVTLLRGASERGVDDGLLAESAVYSALLAGPEFARWRAGRPARRRAEGAEPVLVTRDGDELTVLLNRPDVRNAVDRRVRDALVDAWALVDCDPSLTMAHLRGSGAHFCAGGDLDEFGSFPDTGSAHLVRLQQSAGRGIHRVAQRVTAHLHGWCLGSGIELPAFAGTVIADHTVRIGLPELSLGIIPGAGGTVSLTRRIGRHHTGRLALTGELLDAAAALAIGLIDHVRHPPPEVVRSHHRVDDGT